MGGLSIKKRDLKIILLDRRWTNPRNNKGLTFTVDELFVE